jgi:hypothetical protein
MPNSLNRPPIHNIEKHYKDSMFFTQTLNGGSITNNEEYKRPNVRTWVYTNMGNRDIWLTDHDMPLRATKNNSIFSNMRIYERSVMVIKSYDLKAKDAPEFEVIMDHIFNNYSMDADLRSDILTYLKEDSNISNNLRKTIRLVHVVSEEELSTGYREVFNNILSLDIPIYEPNLRKEKGVKKDEVSIRHNEKSEAIKLARADTPCVELGLGFASVSGYPIDVKIFGEYIHLGCEEDNRTLDYKLREDDAITLFIKKGSNVNMLNSFTRKDLIRKGYTDATELEEDEIRRVDDIRIDKLKDSMDKRFDESMAITKFMYEHNVSLHKLFSYIIREEAAILSLEKEEISTAKEFMKLLGSVK